MKDNTNDKPGQNKATKNRRDLLKKLALSSSALAAGGVLPKHWVRPAVDAVVLPAHARTSNFLFFGLVLNRAQNDDILGEEDSLLAKALDSTVQAAHAQRLRTHGLCIEDLGSTMLVTYQNPANSKRFSGILDKNGTPGRLDIIGATQGCDFWCESKSGSRPARISAVSGTSVTIELPRCQEGIYVLTVNLAESCSFPALDGSCDR